MTDNQVLFPEFDTSGWTVHFWLHGRSNGHSQFLCLSTSKFVLKTSYGQSLYIFHTFALKRSMRKNTFLNLIFHGKLFADGYFECGPGKSELAERQNVYDASANVGGQTRQVHTWLLLLVRGCHQIQQWRRNLDFATRNWVGNAPTG